MTKVFTVEQVKNLVRDSPFRRSCYSVDIPIITLHNSMMMYLDDPKYRTNFPLKDIFLYTPDFQRDNDKWTQEMQISFIQNLILGCQTTIMLYEVCKKGELSGLSNCRILDGLQRITALHQFITGGIDVFGLNYKECLDAKIINSFNGRLKLNIYTFESEEEAISFYISINENITHSDTDIDKAKKCLLSIKNIL